MRFCLQQGLPVNDAWMVAGGAAAAGARDALDDLALGGATTARALAALDGLVRAAHGSGSVRLPGTYPHDQWQGSRIEGFVVSQGQAVTPESCGALQQLLPALASSVLQLGSVAEALRRPYRLALEQYNGDAAATYAHVMASCRAWLPAPELLPVSPEDKQRLVDSLMADRGPAEAAADGGKLRVASTGEAIYSRAVLEAGGFRELAETLRKEMQASMAAALSGGGGGAGAEARGGGAGLRLKEGAALLREYEKAAEAAEAAEAEAQTGAGVDSVGSTPQADRVLKSRLLRVLAGGPELSHTLRYKKKMTMWSLPPTAQPGDVPLDGGEVGVWLAEHVRHLTLPLTHHPPLVPRSATA